MKKWSSVAISYWAKANPWKARILIAGSHAALIFLGILSGLMIMEIGWSISPYWFFGVAALFIVAMVFFPTKTTRSRRLHGYAFVSMLGYFLALSSTGLIMQTPDLFSERNTACGMYGETGFTDIRNQELPVAWSAVYVVGKKPKNSWKRALLDNMREKMRSVVKTERRAQIVLAIFLAFLMSFLLSYAIAVLSCLIYCSGAGALAVMAALIGATGVVILNAVILGIGWPEKTLNERIGSAIGIFLVAAIVVILVLSD